MDSRTLATVDEPSGSDLRFSDVEGERLFGEVRSRLFARPHELVVGRYRVLRRLGVGAMGEVHLALDEELDRPIALKFVHAHLDGPRWAENLRREARALARLAHPNVVGVYEVGAGSQHLYLAMEYIEGGSLREWIATQAPDWSQVLAAYLDAARGLAAAHGAGIVHRDFKPDNVLRGNDGHVAVADFGLAALERGGSHDPLIPATIDDHPPSHSRTGEVKGTPAYMPPEQFRGSGDARADQFALCVSIYEGVWGQRPFAPRSIDTPHHELDWSPSPPPKRRDVPRWLWPILRRGLAPNPSERWPDIQALIDALEGKLAARRRRASWAVGLAVLAIGSLAGALAASWVSSSNPVAVDDCAALEGELDGIWDESRRGQLGAGFGEAAERSARRWMLDSEIVVAAGLDRWRARWLSSRRALCQARAGGDPVILARHGDCLERHRRVTATLVELFVSEPMTLHQAPHVVAGLGDPLTCALEAQQGDPPAPPPELAAAVAAVRDELALVEAELAAARHVSALGRVEAAAIRARALGHAPLLAEVAYWHGAALLAGDRVDEGLEQLERAADLGEGVRHDRVVAHGWQRMASFAATRRDRLEQGRAWLRRAEAAATRIGREPLTDAHLAHIRGNLERHADNLDDAAEQLERALQVFEDHDDRLHASYVASDLGVVELGRGRLAPARTRFEQALAWREQVYGPRHPEVALAAYNLGEVIIALEQPELARPMLERAVEIWTVAEFDRPRDIGHARMILAQLEFDAGEFERGLEHAHAAAIAFADGPSSTAAERAEVNALLATGQYFLGHPAEAVAAYRRAVAGYTRAHGPDDLYTALFRVSLGWALLAAGEIDEAREAFVRGRATIEASFGAGTDESADVRLGLVAVELASQAPTRALAELTQFGAPPSDDMNRLVFELFYGLALTRLHDPRATASLQAAGDRARRFAGGEATLAVLLDSVDATTRERRLVAP